MIVDSGIHVGAGSDSAQISTLDPWLMIYYMVTGKNAAGELINDGQQITRLGFFFSVLVAVALVGNRYFDPRQLPGSEGGHALAITFGAAALLVWLSSLITSVRNSHGS